MDADTLKNAATSAVKKAASRASQRMDAPLSRFFVDVAGMGESAFSVENFRSQDVALSCLGEFEVNVLVRAPVGLDALVGAPARLRLVGSGGTESVLALQVRAVQELPASPEGARLGLQLVSPLYALACRRHNRVFLNRTLEEIIQQVMTDAEFSADSLDICFKQPQPARAMVVQYEESDMDFLSRLLARDGAFYTVKPGAQGAAFLFYDDSRDLADTLGGARLDFHPESGQAAGGERVFQLSRKVSWMSAGVSLSDYNPQAPDRPPLGEAQCRGGQGHLQHWGPQAEDSDQACQLATIRAQALDVQRHTLTARADSAQLLPGMALTLTNHPEHNGDWLVVAAAIQGDQRAGHAFGQNSDRPGLLSELTLIPLEMPYRCAAAWQRKPVHGSFSARVEGDGGDYAYLDDQGRYRIRLPFDGGDSPEGEATPPVRMMQPYGGPNSGMHLPLHAGTEVLLSCVNGDIDRPVILGAISNPQTPTPVTASNASQHILRTRGGNELLMEDRAGEERIELFTADRKNRLSLDASDSGHQVTLETLEGDMEILAGGHMTVEVGASQNETVGETKTVTVTEDLKLMTREGIIELQAGADLFFKSTDSLRLTAEQGDIDVHAGENLIARSDGDTSVEVPNGDARVLVDRGDFSAEVNGALTLRGGGNAPMRFSQGGGSIEISPSGDIVIDGAVVDISGNTIKVDGQQIGGN
ncbi:type VI secretion system Vgr family protein [Isoalcanivorax indicus]|uniref:type VI secretion system Vgr family protein n=1 Tax=Isoalcanivorax indicus TaxID=2202653 RepID=UPI000DB92C22|nr:type VI secretion system tip protein TssI/VgrG [Isoalcanivorax indicus]